MGHEDPYGDGNFLYVNDVVWLLDRVRIASSGSDDTVRIWDTESGEALAVLEHDGSIKRMVLSPDGEHLLTLSIIRGSYKDFRLRVWDLINGEILARLDHDDWIYEVDWLLDGEQIIYRDQSTTRVWDITNDKLLVILEHGNSGNAVDWSPDGELIATGGEDSSVRIWNVSSGEPMVVLEGHSNEVYTVAWSPDGSRLLSGSRYDDGKVQVWDLESEEIIWSGDRRGFGSVDWFVGGQYIMSVNYNNQSLWVRGASSGNEIAILEKHTPQVETVSWLPDGERLITLNWDNTVRVWDVNRREVLSRFGNDVSSVALSSDGKRLATGSWSNRTVQIWDLDSGEVSAVLTGGLAGHTDIVWSVTWSPDGKRLATGGGVEDNTVRIWDVANNELLAVLIEPLETVKGLAWSLDGRYLAAVGEPQSRMWGEGRLLIWDTNYLGGVTDSGAGN